MFLLITFFLISIIFSFLCSIWEAVLLSVTPSYAQIRLKEGGKVGKLLQRFKENIDQPLAAILTLNTIAHTVGAMGVGTQAEKLWASAKGLDFLGIHIGANALVGAGMTLAILILSEIIPKTLGANYWKRLTPFTVKSLDIVIKILWPLVWFGQLITKKLKKDKTKSVLSRADFTAMAQIGAKEGIFEQSESEIIFNLLRFNSIQAKDIMTPRTVVKAANEEMGIKEFYDENRNLHFSRIPIFQNTKDHITGFVLKDEILASIINDKGANPLKDIKRDILVVAEQIVMPTLFDTLMTKREHIALVVDEFGGMAGIVTTEDVLETLLGMEIVDEMDGTEDMQVLARKRWEQRAKALGLVEEQNETPEAQNAEAHTDQEDPPEG